MSDSAWKWFLSTDSIQQETEWDFKNWQCVEHLKSISYLKNLLNWLWHFYGDKLLESPNHHKVMMMEPIWLNPWKLAANLELLIVMLNALQYHNHADIGQLQHKCNRLQLLATSSITITNKQNHNVNDYDYIENNHDYNRECICLETFSERKQTPFVWFNVSIFSDNMRYEWMQHTK